MIVKISTYPTRTKFYLDRLQSILKERRANSFEVE